MLVIIFMACTFKTYLKKCPMNTIKVSNTLDTDRLAVLPGLASGL